jgi:hypothetical protein
VSIRRFWNRMNIEVIEKSEDKSDF